MCVKEWCGARRTAWCSAGGQARRLRAAFARPLFGGRRPILSKRARRGFLPNRGGTGRFPPPFFSGWRGQGGTWPRDVPLIFSVAKALSAHRASSRPGRGTRAAVDRDRRHSKGSPLRELARATTLDTHSPPPAVVGQRAARSPHARHREAHKSARSTMPPKKKKASLAGLAHSVADPKAKKKAAKKCRRQTEKEGQGSVDEGIDGGRCQSGHSSGGR